MIISQSTVHTDHMLQPHRIVITKLSLMNNHEYLYWKQLMHTYDRPGAGKVHQQQSQCGRDAWF